MNNLKKGDIVHIFGISDFMANTTHTEAKATGDSTADGKPIFTENKKGARKKFTFRGDYKDDQLVFIGDVPFKTDGETKLAPTGTSGMFTSSVVRMNACLNLTGHPGTIIYWILQANLNPNFKRYDSVIHIDGEKETPLFPEVPTDHAVVQRIREKITS